MQAFNTLVRKYEDRAYKYAYRLVRSQDEASDIVAAMRPVPCRQVTPSAFR